jgi:hypothetical protein
MLERCTNPKTKGFHRYGGRGITVFPTWSKDFKAFLDYIGLPPTSKHSIDRFPDNDGNYEPGNVRWATVKEQHENMTHVHAGPVLADLNRPEILRLHAVSFSTRKIAARVGVSKSYVHRIISESVK